MFLNVKDNTSPPQKLGIGVTILAFSFFLGIPIFHYFAALMVGLLVHAHREDDGRETG